MLAPLLNAAIQNISKPSFDLTLVGLFVVFVLIATPLLHDPLVLNVGYSAIWLCLLYVVGAYMHKYDIPSKFKKKQALGIFMLMVLITFASKIVCRFLNITLFENILVSYTSPTILLSSIALFITFAKMNDIRPLQKVIRVLAPASLGVYLLHEHPIIRKHLIFGFSENFVSHNFIVMILLVLGASCGIYLLCSAIELVRIKLFALLRIKDLCNKIESFIMKIHQSSEVVNSK
jgi:surface polysaccharide O-acyltransferase-like enzyme